MNQTLLSNGIFLFLFLLMLWSWIEPFFLPRALNDSEPLVAQAIAVESTTKRPWAKSITFFGVCIANILLALFLSLRWIESGHFPLSNLYESLIFLAWSFTTIHISCSWVFPNMPFLNAITTPMVLLTYTFASFSLPQSMQKASALVPALQSNWLMMHVSIMILSYAALLCGSLIAVVFLLTPASRKFADIKQKPDTAAIQGLPAQAVYLEESLTPFGQNVDNLSYRILGLGFPLLTLGILSGAVWANEAWGSYWSWDPKETWALITWLVFAIYLHTRLTKGWRGTKSAMVATVGFVTVWVCYLGVNLLGSGLHSYGWFSS
jgi:cytochrome c-type biogenesis protein CcsB